MNNVASTLRLTTQLLKLFKNVVREHCSCLEVEAGRVRAI